MTGKRQRNDRLRSARVRRGWSQKEAAERAQQLAAQLPGHPELSIDDRYFSRWEAGSVPHAHHIALLCQLYDSSPAAIGLPGDHILVSAPNDTTSAWAPPTTPGLSTPGHVTLEAEGPMDRRQFTAAMIGLPFATAAHALDSELPLRLLHLLTRPATIDAATVDYLSDRTAQMWNDWSQRRLAAPDILPYTVHEIRRLTDVLTGSAPPGLRLQLCSTIAQTAMLAGEILWDMRAYPDAREYLRTAVLAAHEASEPTLEAVIWARRSFTWTYGERTHEALAEAIHCIQAARSLPNSNSHVTTWLCAVEAEVRAAAGDRSGCLTAIAHADPAHLPDHTPERADEADYWIQCDASLLAGYHGACFLSLGQPRDAEHSLQDSLNSSNTPRRLPTLLVDLGRACTLDGRIDEACGIANKLLDSIITAKSAVALQRFTLLMKDLESAPQARCVQHLTERFVTVTSTAH